MFIRWKRRKKAEPKRGRRPRRGSQSGDSLYCVLVESLRVSGGPPRQKVISYLGSVDDELRENKFMQLVFWDQVAPKLDQLCLSSEQRIKIEESIGKTIARLPEDKAADCREYMRRAEFLRRHGLL